MTDIVHLHESRIASRHDEPKEVAAIRSEGMGLLDLYKQIEDAEVRQAIHNLLNSISSKYIKPFTNN